MFACFLQACSCMVTECACRTFCTRLCWQQPWGSRSLLLISATKAPRLDCLPSLSSFLLLPSLLFLLVSK